jgi:hypothetical protein
MNFRRNVQFCIKLDRMHVEEMNIVLKISSVNDVNLEIKTTGGTSGTYG